jgi:subtilisin family serine protease
MMLLVATSTVFAANEPKFDKNNIFIKLTSDGVMPTSTLIKNVKHLFGDNYLVSKTNSVALINQLKGNENILKTEKNYYAGKKLLPEVKLVNIKSEPMLNFSSFNDPRVGRIWSFLDASKNGVSVDKSYITPLSLNKTEIIVAVVDTGVYYKHEDLKDIMWVNKNEIPGNKIDDDNNGYVDDIHGINTLKRRSDGSAMGNPMGSHSHGTHVAGTIAATQNNNVGIAGIAANARIMAIRAVPDDSDETDKDIVESFLYAAKHGAKLINCSFGKSHNEGGMIVNETIDHIGKTYGALVLAAAGNDYGRDIDTDKAFPASFESEYLLVVASTAKSGGLSWFSNIGLKSVDLAAPGSNIYSTVKNNKYANMSGTSMATPTTTGVAAEVLSHFPSLSPLELKKVLMESVTPVKNFKNKMVSPGRVDLYNSLRYTLDNFNSL